MVKKKNIGKKILASIETYFPENKNKKGIEVLSFDRFYNP